MKNIFETNPSLKEYFETSDGRKFYTKNAAENHARTLDKDKREIKHVERDNAITDASSKTSPLDEIIYNMSMNRNQLDEVAKKAGFDSTQLGTKQDVIDAIDAFLKQGEEDGAGDESSDEDDTAKESAEGDDNANESGDEVDSDEVEEILP